MPRLELQLLGVPAAAMPLVGVLREAEQEGRTLV